MQGDCLLLVRWPVRAATGITIVLLQLRFRPDFPRLSIFIILKAILLTWTRRFRVGLDLNSCLPRASFIIIIRVPWSILRLPTNCLSVTLKSCMARKLGMAFIIPMPVPWP